jgi:hypothetical protein
MTSTLTSAGILMSALLRSIDVDEKSAATIADADLAQRADERAEEGRKAARHLFTAAFPGVDPSDFARRVGL